MDLEATAESIEPRVRPSPVDGLEYFRGWVIHSHPFDSGHVLVLRVFPENVFAPYEAIWHRDPEGEWTIYVDGPRLDTACPRFFGAAARDSLFADISLEWTGPMDLTVEMDDPELIWTVSMAASPLVSLSNATTANVPEALARTRPMTRTMEMMGNLLFDLGEIDLAGVTPNGQEGVMVTRRLSLVESASARLDGIDLGEPATVDESPTFGELRFPKRPLFAIGSGYFSTLDEAEFERTVAELREHSTPSGA